MERFSQGNSFIVPIKWKKDCKFFDCDLPLDLVRIDNNKVLGQYSIFILGIHIFSWKE